MRQSRRPTFGGRAVAPRRRPSARKSPTGGATLGEDVLEGRPSAESQRARENGGLAQTGDLDGRRVRQPASEQLTNAVEEQIAVPPDAAAEHDQSHVRDRRDRCDVEGDPARDLVDGVAGDPVPATRLGEDVAGVVGRHERRLARTGQPRGESGNAVRRRVELAPDGLAAHVEVIEELGADAYLFCHTELEGGETKLVVRVDARHRAARGERIFLRPRPGEALVFDCDSGARLGGT
jgi:hypothetical protein